MNAYTNDNEVAVIKVRGNPHRPTDGDGDRRRHPRSDDAVHRLGPAD